MTILSKVTFANGDSAQTVLYSFLLLLYKVSPYKIFCLYGVGFMHFLFIEDKCVFFLSSNCKTNTPLTSVIINLKYIIITAAMKVETDTIASITESPVGRGAILEIMYVETFKTDIAFIRNIIMCLRSH